MASRDDLLPELVRDSELQTKIRRHLTIHEKPPGHRATSRWEMWAQERMLDHGGYGVVWLQSKVDEGGSGPGSGAAPELRAVKQIQKSKLRERKNYVRELEALAKFSQDKYSSFFVKYHGWYESTESLYIAMEYCEHGDLKTFLDKNGPLTEDVAQDIAAQVLGALSLMHKEGFAHRDVKPRNILIKRMPPQKWWVKLCDLGLSKRTEDISATTHVGGTPGFMAPEAVGLDADAKTADAYCADMWCFGETVYRALTGRATFNTVVDLLEYRRGHSTFPDDALEGVGASVVAVDFVRKLMRAAPKDRLTAAEAFEHPWMPEEQTVGPPEPGQDSGSPVFQPTAPYMVGGHQLTQPSGEWTVTGPHKALPFRPGAQRTPSAEQLTQPSGAWTSIGPSQSVPAFDVPSPTVANPSAGQFQPPIVRSPTGSYQAIPDKHSSRRHSPTQPSAGRGRGLPLSQPSLTNFPGYSPGYPVQSSAGLGRGSFNPLSQASSTNSPGPRSDYSAQPSAGLARESFKPGIGPSPMYQPYQPYPLSLSSYARPNYYPRYSVASPGNPALEGAGTPSAGYWPIYQTPYTPNYPYGTYIPQTRPYSGTTAASEQRPNAQTSEMERGGANDAGPQAGGTEARHGTAQTEAPSRFSGISSANPHVEPPHDPATTTDIQFQFLHVSGPRRFRTQDPVRRLYEWIKAELRSASEGRKEGHEELMEFTLRTTPQGRDLIDDLDRTIEEAGLKMGTVVLELIEPRGDATLLSPALGLSTTGQASDGHPRAANLADFPSLPGRPSPPGSSQTKSPLPRSLGPAGASQANPPHATRPAPPGTEPPPPARQGSEPEQAPPARSPAEPARTTAETGILRDFKDFAAAQRKAAEKTRADKARADRKVKLSELRKFAGSFKLDTPIPADLVDILAKDPEKQRRIQYVALKRAAEAAERKAAAGGDQGAARGGSGETAAVDAAAVVEIAAPETAGSSAAARMQPATHERSDSTSGNGGQKKRRKGRKAKAGPPWIRGDL